jgi:hypothetical protein
MQGPCTCRRDAPHEREKSVAMRTHSLIKLTLLAFLLLGANAGSQASAQDADALRNLQVDDYFALKSVTSQGQGSPATGMADRPTNPGRIGLQGEEAVGCRGEGE